MNECIVAIPIYKDDPLKIEMQSFKQVLKILFNYDITIFTYRELNISKYLTIASEVKKSFNIVYFDKHFFTNGLIGYNKLLLSKSFYENFKNYKYILIYQLDAWVFRDELEYWCNQNYDYIGAPWFKLNENDNYTFEFDGVGNGGLSLRKISYCITILDYPSFKPFINLRHLIKTINHPIEVLKLPFKLLSLRNNITYYINNKVFNEDYIFSSLTLKSNIKANIPNELTASKFAFEVNPSFLYEKNNKQLPFGCHAFKKFEFNDFWNKYIIDEYDN